MNFLSAVKNFFAFSRRHAFSAVGLAGIVMLGGCAATTAFVVQNPQGALRPSNVTADDNGVGLMLKGADVVAYFTEGKHRQGVAEFQTRYEGVNFRFASAAHRDLFEKEPAKYLPAYNGYCANGIVYGIPWGGDADNFKLVGGKLYIFGGQGSLDGWNLDEQRNLALADKYWNEEVKGSNSFVQRAKRSVFDRVPHYLSGDELVRAVTARKAKG